MNDEAVLILVTVEGDVVVLERLTGGAREFKNAKRLRTEIKSLEAFEAQVGSARYLVSEAWGIGPQSIVFVDPDGNELHP